MKVRERWAWIARQLLSSTVVSAEALWKKIQRCVIPYSARCWTEEKNTALKQRLGLLGMPRGFFDFVLIKLCTASLRNRSESGRS